MDFLVIVDMQPTFEGSQNLKLIKNIKNQIRLAKRRESHIIVVEYLPWGTDRFTSAGRTDWRIMSAIGNYPNLYFVNKRADNGGGAIARALRDIFPNGGHRDASFRVVGVNATACVVETIGGLTTHFPRAKILVPIDCVRDGWRGCQPGKRTYQRMMPKNAVVV